MWLQIGDLFATEILAKRQENYSNIGWIVVLQLKIVIRMFRAAVSCPFLKLHSIKKCCLSENFIYY